MPQTIPLIHSSYNASTGTSLATSITAAGVVVPSVVDSMLVLAFCENPTSFLISFGAQNATQIGSWYGMAGLFFINKPTPSTNSVVMQWGISCRAAMFVCLLESTLPSGYARDTTGSTGVSTGMSAFPTFVAGDRQFGIYVWNNRDSVGIPTIVGNDTWIHNTIVNSGGGASSYGFIVSTNDGAVGNGFVVGFSTSTTWSIIATSLKNSNYNSTGTLTIRHAP